MLAIADTSGVTLDAKAPPSKIIKRKIRKGLRVAIVAQFPPCKWWTSACHKILIKPTLKKKQLGSVVPTNFLQNFIDVVLIYPVTIYWHVLFTPITAPKTDYGVWARVPQAAIGEYPFSAR